MGIVSGVLIFYSAEIDLRNTEADILSIQLSRCVFDNGFVKDGFLNGKLDFVKDCWLGTDSFEKDSFFGKITLTDSNRQIVRSVSFGPSTYEKDCLVGSKVVAPTYPRCSVKTFSVSYLASDGLKSGFLEVVGGSNNFGRRYSEDANFKIQ